ncbi:hypothetical protein ARMSODRAFT_946545 [Armillaria solidipes]|uniref:Uncharacterized protein n=1 Tax=Armillaria solidipes TaxID=1076256 RepID=A0A2H3C3Q3_9AGAR|nr:hypothetical protein ARMSODRAFT_946545 [Armillaria solidipes]
MNVNLNMNMMCWSQQRTSLLAVDDDGNRSPSAASTVYVICTAPLIAPKPLPYHSPTFLQFKSLPDLDQDLSHPPYTYRPKEPVSVMRRAKDKTRQNPYPQPGSRPRLAHAKQT